MILMYPAYAQGLAMRKIMLNRRVQSRRGVKYLYGFDANTEGNGVVEI